MKPFEHVNAKTTAEAIDLLSHYQGKAKLIAGGTDLLGELKDRVLSTYPEILVNIKTIPDMNYIKEESGVLKIGALAKISEVADSPIIRDRYNILAQAAWSVGFPQIRSMGTIGGNLCQDIRCWYYRYPYQIGGSIKCWRKGGSSCPAVSGDNRYHAILEGEKCFAVCPSDMAVALDVLEASVRIIGPAGARTVPVREFYSNLGNTLKPDEIITEIQVPRPPESARQIFNKYRLRNSIDFAILSAALVLTINSDTCKDAKISLGSLAARPLRAIEAEEAIRGKEINVATAEEAAELAVKGAVPLSKNAFKMHRTKILIQRTLLALTSDGSSKE